MKTASIWRYDRCLICLCPVFGLRPYLAVRGTDASGELNFIMAETKANMNLADWLLQISHAKNRAEIYKILDEFRPMTWTDNERSQMAKHYIRILDLLPPEEDDEAGGKGDEKQGAEGDDGPVWYEKM